MSARTASAPQEAGAWNPRLALLLAAAMFVLVFDTSLMNVSISAVVHDLNTTVSGVQSAIALEALVSAAFILIMSKVGDLIGRKRGYVIGLLGYAVGALAMVLDQTSGRSSSSGRSSVASARRCCCRRCSRSSTATSRARRQKRVYALVGAAAAIAAAIGPLLGGFITTFLSWRVGFLLELVVIAVVLSGIGMVKDVPYTGDRRIDLVGAVFSVFGMGGLVLGILVWQEGGEVGRAPPGGRGRRRSARSPGGSSAASARAASP